MNGRIRIEVACRVLGVLCAFPIWLAPADGHAAAVTSPDQICPASANPCIVSSMFEVDSAMPLDFGGRTVRVVEGGGFKGTLDLTCGGFVSESSDIWLDVLREAGGGDATITALRTCSGDSARTCLDDEVCEDAAAGTCTVGDGGIRMTGQVRGVAPVILFRGAGDVALEGLLNAHGRSPAPDGGSVTIESGTGSIESAAVIDVNAGRDPDYGGPGYGGTTSLRAARDVTIRAEIRATGGGANVTVDAGRDIIVGASVFAQGRAGGGAMGGTVELNAAHDLEIVRLPGIRSPRLDVSGGSFTGRYGTTYGYPGGYGIFNAGNDMLVGAKVALVGNSGDSGYSDSRPFNGNFYLEAEGRLDFHGTVNALGYGPFGGGWGRQSFVGNNVNIGKRAKITTFSAYSSSVYIRGSDFGPVSIDGRINVEGRTILGSYGSVYGSGGQVAVYGGDVNIGGRLRGGGGRSGGNMNFSACHLTLKRNGRIDGKHGRLYDGAGYNEFRIGDTMVTEPGSLIQTGPTSFNSIVYANPLHPPQLQGQVSPPPAISHFPSPWGCPFCGDYSIEEGEACDDGNTAGGDGCNADCQLEL